MRFIPLLIVGLVVATAGCGFQPVYSKKSHVQSSRPNDSKVFAGVMIEPMPGREGNQLQMELEDKLNPEGVVPANPDYRLVVNLDLREIPIGVGRDANVSRFNIYLFSHYTLYRRSDGKAVTSGNIRHVGSYNNAENAYFSTYVSRVDGISRGITELAELYRLRLASYLYSGAKPEKLDPARKPPVQFDNPQWPGTYQDPFGAPVPGAIALP